MKKINKYVSGVRDGLDLRLYNLFNNTQDNVQVLMCESCKTSLELGHFAIKKISDGDSKLDRLLEYRTIIQFDQDMVQNNSKTQIIFTHNRDMKLDYPDHAFRIESIQ